jgi:hypothetical protein
VTNSAEYIESIRAALGPCAMDWAYNDGGRRSAGFKGSADDCVVRAIAIGLGLDYSEVYAELYRRAEAFGASGRSRVARAVARKPSPRLGVHRKVYQPYLLELGWEWVPTMAVGAGTQLHLHQGELPEHGTFIVRLSRHLSAVVDGVVQDTHDPSRDGKRCVYGIYASAEDVDLLSWADSVLERG